MNGNSISEQDLQKLRYLMSLAVPRPVFMMFETLTQLGIIILGWVSLPLEMLVRHTFGEEYLSLFRIGIALWMLSVFTFFYSLYAVMSGNSMAFMAYSGMTRSLWNTGAAGFVYHLFYYLVIAAAIYHRYGIWQRNRNGVPWHSNCFGVSHLAAIPWQRFVNRIPYVGPYIIVDDYCLYRFVESMLMYVCGRLITPLDGLVGSYIVVASVALFIKNNMVYAQERHRALAMNNAAIEGAYLADAVAGQPKELTAGFSVVPVPMQSLTNHHDLDVPAIVHDTLGTASDA